MGTPKFVASLSGLQVAWELHLWPHLKEGQFCEGPSP